MNVEPREPHEPTTDKERELIAPGESQSAQPAPVTLTPEEQMAAFEQELKETDWGHQPC